MLEEYQHQDSESRGLSFDEAISTKNTKYPLNNPNKIDSYLDSRHYLAPEAFDVSKLTKKQRRERIFEQWSDPTLPPLSRA